MLQDMPFFVKGIPEFTCTFSLTDSCIVCNHLFVTSLLLFSLFVFLFFFFALFLCCYIITLAAANCCRAQSRVGSGGGNGGPFSVRKDKRNCLKLESFLFLE